MGGRGGSSGMNGTRISESQARKLEDKAQFNDTRVSGYRLGARFFEYTDSNGKVLKGETGNNKPGGIYRASYNQQVADYAKKSTTSLRKERAALKEQSNDAYQKFTRAAASRSGSQAASFADADHKIKMIDQVLRRRKKR